MLQHLKDAFEISSEKYHMFQLYESQRHLDLYDRMLKEITHDNLTNKLNTARGEHKPYISFDNICFNGLFASKRNREKFLYTINPYDGGTIYDVLSVFLTELLDKPWHFDFHEFKLYVLWGELSKLDKMTIFHGETYERLKSYGREDNDEELDMILPEDKDIYIEGEII